MSANLKLVVPASSEKPDDVLIHVRYAPNAEIVSIDALPANMKAGAWLERLYAAAGQHYQTLAGGRGFFRVPRNTYEMLLVNCAS